jgi:peptidoglycan/xylan/chitin deacetylase (PgdA/CDA1 family)
MFLKRTFVLAAGIFFFLAGFIGLFKYRDMQMDNRFRQERQAYGVEGAVLTTQIAPSPIPAPAPSSTPDAAPSAPPEANETPAPASNPDAAPSPAEANQAPAPATTPETPSGTDTNAPPISAGAKPEAPDANIIIGPLPPSTSPESTPAPSNSTSSNTNPDAPAAAPSSTMLYPGPARYLGLCMLSAVTPAPTPAAAGPAAEPPAAPANPTPAPALSTATNGPAAMNPAANAAPASGTTNAIPTVTAPGTARPEPVDSSVIVLLYHQFAAPGVKIPPKFQWTLNQDVFEAEMKYIHDNGYHVVPLADMIRFLKHQIGLPPNSVVITIDDGYKSAIVYAEPILKQYGYPWTFFIYPDFITTAESKGAASWSDLHALQAEGVDIESHSMTHPQLTRHHQLIKGVWHNFSPEEYDQWLTNETLGSKTLLEQKMGKPITCFAYPYGDYNKQVEAKAIAAGYEAIFTVADNPVHSTTPLTSIGRYTITQGVEKNFPAYLRQSALGLTKADPLPGETITNPRPVITAVLNYTGTIDPNSLETSVRDFGPVHHDFDPKTSTVRLYLPRDLIEPVVLVNLRVRNTQTNQIMVANWYFNYEAPGAEQVHPPIGSKAPAINGAPVPPSNGNQAATPPIKGQPPIPSSASVSAATAISASNQTAPSPAATVVH